MNYINSIREHIGHDLVMTVGCGVIIENKEGQILLQKRSDTGEWSLPGGALEPIETYEQAAKREVWEEAGIEVRNLKLFGIYSGKQREIHYPNKDVVYSLAVMFWTNEYSGVISDTDSEVIEHRFFNRKDIPAELFPCDSKAILDWAKGVTEIVVD